MKRRVVSIFSGIDCIGMGFREDFDVVLAVEKEAKACATLTANKSNFHPNLEVWNRDICSVKDSEIEQFRDVDGIIGGPPCQAFSTARGTFDPNDERIYLIFEYLRWVKIINPKFFVFENVEGLLFKERISIFEKFIEEASKLGYTINYKLVNSHDYGSAQQRKRVIAVGFRNDLDLKFEFPQPVQNKKYVRDILDNGNTGEYVEARARIREIMPHVPEGGCWKDLKTEDLLEKALGVNYKKRGGGMTGVCRRLHRDRPCPTLLTSPVENTTLLYHPTEDRPLSITEYKRGQGIPESYNIVGTLREQYKFIGNGVPVEMSYEIARAISRTLDTRYDSFNNSFDNNANDITEKDNSPIEENNNSDIDLISLLELVDSLYDDSKEDVKQDDSNSEIEIAISKNNQLCFVF